MTTLSPSINASWKRPIQQPPALDKFQWHNSCVVRNHDGNALSLNDSLSAKSSNAICNIADRDCAATLIDLHNAIRNELAFCVSKTTSSTSTNTLLENIEQANDTPEHRQPSTQIGSHYFHTLSGGSSGQAKRIRRTQRSWIQSFETNKFNAGLSPQDSYAIIGKLSHSLALYAALEAAWVGADIHALAELRPDKQFISMLELNTSVLYATPTQLRMLCRNISQASNIDSHNKTNQQLRVIFCGGGKLDALTHSILKRCFPQATIKVFYGAAETSFISISDDTTPIDSVGKLYPCVELEVRNAPNKTAPGDLWVKSPYLFTDYSAGTESNTQWQNDFLSIGELGYVDANGYLYLCGRHSRMITIADNNVFPEQIEQLLMLNEKIHCCAVIPIADKQRGSTLLAVVEADASVQLEAELIDACRQRFGTLYAPRSVTFTKELPKLASGKPDFVSINQRYKTHE